MGSRAVETQVPTGFGDPQNWGGRGEESPRALRFVDSAADTVRPIIEQGESAAFLEGGDELAWICRE